MTRRARNVSHHSTALIAWGWPGGSAAPGAPSRWRARWHTKGTSHSVRSVSPAQAASQSWACTRSGASRPALALSCTTMWLADAMRRGSSPAAATAARPGPAAPGPRGRRSRRPRRGGAASGPPPRARPGSSARPTRRRWRPGHPPPVAGTPTSPWRCASPATVGHRRRGRGPLRRRARRARRARDGGRPRWAPGRAWRRCWRRASPPRRRSPRGRRRCRRWNALRP